MFVLWGGFNLMKKKTEKKPLVDLALLLIKIKHEIEVTPIKT